jgi:hypothetical protein
VVVDRWRVVVTLEGMDSEERASPGTAWTLHGLPQTRHSSLTPEGEIEQAAKFAHGLRAPRHGWRKVVVRAGFLLIAVAVLSTLASAIYFSQR